MRENARHQLEDLEAARERWLKEEIPARLEEIRADPSIGIPAEQVSAELDAHHRARIAKPGR